eukprot:gene21383-27413_t
MIPVATESIKQAVEQLNSFKDLYSSKIESNLDQINGSKGSAKQNNSKANSKKPPVRKAAVRESYSAPYEYQPSYIAESSDYGQEDYSNNNDNSSDGYLNNHRDKQQIHSNASSNIGIASRVERLNIDNSHTQHMSGAERENLLTQKISEFNEQRQQQNKNAVDPQKLAKMRIQQKIREEAKVKELQEVDAARRKAAEVEASVLKVQTLQAKTELRVAKYKESLLRREQEEREKAELELFVRKEREKEAFSDSKRNKLVALRKESVKRLRQIEQEDERREIERHVAIQAKLDLISKKYDVNSTFLLPAVGGGAPLSQQPSVSSGGRNSARGSGGVAVRVDGRVVSGQDNSDDWREAGNNKPRSASRSHVSRAKESKQTPALPPIGGMSGGGGALTERSRSEQQAVRKGKTQPLVNDHTPIARSNSTNNTRLLQYNDQHYNNNSGSHNNATSSQRYRQEKDEDDEWSEDDAPVYGAGQRGATSRPSNGGDCDDGDNDSLEEDSIDLSRGQSARGGGGGGGGGFNKQHQHQHQQAAKGVKPSYNHGDDDDGELSDISGENGALPSTRGSAKPSNRRSAAALPVLGNKNLSQKVAPSQVNIRVESSSRIPGPASTTSSQKPHGGAAVARDKVKNSPNDRITPLVEINQQHVKQQQQQYSASSPTDSSKKSNMSSHNNKNAVWRKLKPIPILPYKPVPVGDN